jgi:transposase
VSVSESLLPVRSVMELLNQELADADHRFEALVAEDPIVKRLTTCPNVGPITATAFVAARRSAR